MTKMANDCLHILMRDAMPDRRLVEDDVYDTFDPHKYDYNERWFQEAKALLQWMEVTGHANSVSYMNMIAGFFNDANPPTGHQYLGIDWSQDDMQYLLGVFERAREGGMVLDLLSYRHLLAVAYHCGKDTQTGGDSMDLCHSVMEEMHRQGMQVPLDMFCDLQMYYLNNEQLAEAVDALENMARCGPQPPSLSMCNWLIDAFDLRRLSTDSTERQEELSKLVDRVLDVMNVYDHVIIKDYDTDADYISDEYDLDFDSDYDEIVQKGASGMEDSDDYSSGYESYSDGAEEEEEEEEEQQGGERGSQVTWENVHLSLISLSEPYDSFCHRLSEFRFKRNKVEIKYEVEPNPKGRRVLSYSRPKETKDLSKQEQEEEEEEGSASSDKSVKVEAAKMTKRGKRKD